LSPNHTLGSLIDTIEVATPPRSMSSTERCGVQSASGRWPVLRPTTTSVIQRGGAR